MLRYREPLTRLVAVGLLMAGIGTASAEIMVHDAWSRATPPGHPTGAVYFELINKGRLSDALVGVSTARAPRSEIHRTIEEGGNSRMVHTPRVRIPAEGGLTFEPGGRHIMLMGLEQALAEGETYEIVLELEDGGELPVEVEVLPPTAMGGSGHQDDHGDMSH
ncbi:copper chaperone PCu(A)C [Spiribacter onubensis]|uniref:Copper chaperone PCu(A)C n=1 Tax=Spiribacter onubensis TaxID=3122420 RepID=A0ABV3SBZ9_9GAMM